MDEKKKEIKENKKEENVEVKSVKVKETKKEEKIEKKVETPKVEVKKFEVKNEKTKNTDTKTNKSRWIASVATVVAVLAIAVLLTYMIVTSSDPKKTVNGFLTNLKAGDFEKAQEFVSGEKFLKDNEFDLETKRLFFDKLSWKVTKVTKGNDNATVEVEVTNKDFNVITEQVQTTTQTKTIQLVKEDEKWMIESNEELENALLPGLQEVANSLGN